MTTEELKAALTEVIQDSGLILQVRQTGSQLVIMMNCPHQNVDARFQDTAAKLLETLIALDLPKITSAKFYGRYAGNPKPTWQQAQPLAAPLSSANSTQIKEESPMAVKTFVNKKNQAPSDSPPALNNVPSLLTSNLAVPILLAGILGVQILTGLAAMVSQPQADPVQWEYKVEAVPDLSFTEAMNRYGAEGWDLVTARRARDPVTDEFSYECIFKRVAQDD